VIRPEPTDVVVEVVEPEPSRGIVLRRSEVAQRCPSHWPTRAPRWVACWQAPEPATVATRGGNVRQALNRERREIGATTEAGRAGIAESWDRASEEIRGAVKDDDEYLEGFSEVD
jgi:hypothetical protein